MKNEMIHKDSKSNFKIRLIMRAMQLPILFIFLTLILYIVPCEWTALRVIIGATSFFFIPGYCVTRSFLNEYEQTKRIVFSYIFGFVIQLFNILFLYVSSSFFSSQIGAIASGQIDMIYEQILHKELDLGFILFFLTLTLIVSFSVVETQLNKKPSNEEKSRGSFFTYIKNNTILLLILILALIVRLYYQSFINTPATDGALYLDQARNLVLTGKFTSKVIGVEGPTFFWNQLGLSFHLFTYFGIALFFLIGGVDFFVAKLMTVFIGTLSVFMVYELAEKLYKTRVAIVASTVAAIHPLLIHYSAVIYGPEIMGTFFILGTYYFFLTSIREDVKKYSIFAGIMGFLSLHTTWYAFVVFLFAIVLCSIFSNLEKHAHHRLFLNRFISMIIFGISLYLVINITALNPLSSMSIYYWLLVISMLAVSVLIALKQRNDRYLISVEYMFLTVGMLSLLTEIRAFYIFNFVPQPVLHSTRVPSVEQDSLSLVYKVLSNFNTNFLNRLGTFFLNSVAGTVSYPLLFFSFLFPFGTKKIQENIMILSYITLFLAMVVAGYWDIPNWYMYTKLTLFITPFFILMAAFSLVQLTENLPWINFRIIMKTRERTDMFRLSLSNLYVVLLMAIVLSSFIPSYSGYISKFTDIPNRSFGIGFQDLMRPVEEWLKTNTPENTVIMSTKPYDMAWITNRITVFLINSDATEPKDYYNLDVSGLLHLIKKFKVNYIIVEEYNTFGIPAVSHLLCGNPYVSDVVFQTVDKYGKKVIIYNVTSISYFDNG